MERLLRLVLPLPRIWIVIVLVAALVSTISVGRTSGGGWSVTFQVTTVTVVLVGLIWLPAVLRLLALAGGGLKTPAGEVTTPGLAELLRSLDPAETTVPELDPKSVLQPVLEPRLADTEVPDLRSTGTIASHVPVLVRQLVDPSAADYAVVDLGVGDRWLTSRLFLFAELLARMRDLRCFVFVRSESGGQRRFVGTALPLDVRWALAEEYPWLERAYAQAYAQLPQHEIRSAHGALTVEEATQLISTFVAAVQAPVPPATGPGGWVQLNGGSWEHGAWLDPDLPGPLRAVLVHATVAAGSDAEDARVARDVLARRGARFVALVGPDSEFQRLVDRGALLEQTAARLSQASKVMAPGYE